MKPECNCEVCTAARNIQKIHGKEIGLLIELSAYSYLARNLIEDIITVLPEEVLREYIACLIDKQTINEDEFTEAVNQFLSSVKRAVVRMKSDKITNLDSPKPMSFH